MAAVLQSMTPPTLYVEEKKNRVSTTVQSGAPMLHGFSDFRSKRPIYLSQVGYEAVCIDYNQLPVLSLSLISSTDLSAIQQEGSFHLTNSTTDLIDAASTMFRGSVALSGEYYDLLCDMMDADALSAMQHNPA
ncbi:MAG: hypothetical protein ACRYG7_41915 [Janthinobacterium lividum]